MTEPIETLPESPPPASANWLEVWKTLLTDPQEETYARVAASGEPKQAYLWIFLATSIGMFFSFLIGSLTNSDMVEAIGASFVMLLCMAPFMGALVTLMAALGVALVQWVAKMMGGEGKFDPLMYLYGGITAPISLISSVIGVIPFLGGFVGFLLSMYALYLQAVAIKAVNRFSWGKAVASLLLPGLILGLLVACCFVILLALMGPAIGEVFSSIQTMP